MNPVDWFRAQDLLFQLIQALTPLTVQALSTSFFLNQRFCNPQISTCFGSVPTRHAILALSKELEKVEAEIHQRIEERPAASHKKTIAMAEELKGEGRTEIVNRQDSMRPLASQAERLIREVHKAISQLSAPAYLTQPCSEPLEEALKRLKPQLDRIIETVQRGEKSDRCTLPDVVQQQLDPSDLKTIQKNTWELGRPLEHKTSQPEHRAQEGLKKLFSEADVAKNKRHPNEHIQLTDRLHSNSEKGGEPKPRLLDERPYLPGAPFQFLIKQAIEMRRKRKKRKSFWFKEKEDDSSS
ncbi:MAG: hypothetical protein ACD_17C00296G0003 [uncultured bacterium]|nr:MAG: hypothetical protein ACD_17C00296G0003 [uncultured bacterium]OGN56861.1 MAG: hypothetical protein A2796_06720 [Chlamydiae bacterium RIFCSPHIGHO2_01_FULL_44_39]OGN59320.1 MAG: hypothetical protein A3C42_06385 [Chlamydiae bacterium RIFCSPHIGHO2_02_FULL_45_9]OGN59519.1 MAG: hypothetical protein A3D96_07410 [Chlamydiae bacterium RIFCSPHIGHO2_12_FULL_44_59]OGN67264.1 MAG: hypothetical protein A2978_03240 [Chlamydiae bacterium RIFCSPLOWO2_01_FULL_44_52]OGN68686.1 MAG: hypothetical protein A3